MGVPTVKEPFMRIQSPLSNLSDVLRQSNASAKLYQTTLKTNEAATRAVLVDPVLRALGWDTANTDMVEVEKTLGQARADYALYDRNAAVKIIIEAKSLSANLNHPNTVMSLVNYAFTFKLQDIFLTDGLIWHHFTNFQPGNVIANKILDMAHDDPIECAAYLVQWLDAAKFWPDEQTLDTLAHQVTQLENTVATLQRDLALLQSVTPPATGQIVSTPVIASSSNASAGISTFVELDQIDTTLGQKPTQLRLPDGTILKIGKWKDVLRECCKLALATNPAIPIPFADKSGRKVALFNTVKPATGISYVTEQYNGQTVYIYVNYDANNCIANTIHVLKQVPRTHLKVKPGVSFN
jgi:hypothetical protein